MAIRLATTRAKLGARILDLTQPGWAQRITLSGLRMAGCGSCVLGQLFGDYWRGAEAVFALRKSEGEYGPHKAAIEAGFHDSDGRDDVTYGNLQKAWVREIETRQLAEIEKRQRA
jgi:hypothetical protein